MKKILFLLLTPFILLANTHIPIDERVTDIYFANGIMNSQEDADKSLIIVKNELARVKYNGDKDEMLLHHNFDTAYNESYGMGLDLFESFLQLIAQSPTATSLWSAFKTYVGSQTKIDFIDLIEDWVTKAKNADLSTQITSYTNSIEAGHGVIVVAHSQGNLFTNRAYNEFGASSNIRKDEWMKQYVRAIGIATPANNVLGENFPYMTFDNDMIQLVPDSLSTNVTNPTRYHFTNAVGNKIETIYSVEAHSFLSSYMATSVTRNAILGFIDSAISAHDTAPSQWKKSSEFACGCEKRINVVHEYDPSLDGLMKGVKIVMFDEFLGRVYNQT